MTRAIAVRRSSIAYALLGVVIAAVLYVLWLLLFGALWGAVVAVVFGGALAGLAYLRSDAMALRSIGARAAAENELPRLDNLLEALTVTHGFRSPTIYIIDDSAPNAAVVGRTPRHGAVALTTGLLQRLERVELEAVLAHELTRIRTGESALNVTASTLLRPVAVLSPGLAAGLAGRLMEGTSVVAADMQSAGITRYPPGLAGALSSMQRDGRVVAANQFGHRHLWINPPEGSMVDSSFSLDDRIAVLQEL